MKTLVVDPRDPELQVGPGDGRATYTATITTVPDRVPLSSGQFIFDDGLPRSTVVQGAPIKFDVPACDGAEISQAWRGRFIYRVTVEKKHGLRGRARPHRTVFEGQVLESQAASVQVTALLAALAVPPPYVGAAELLAAMAGKPDLAANGEASSSKAVRADDARLTDARPQKVNVVTTGSTHDVVTQGPHLIASLAVTDLPPGNKTGMMHVDVNGPTIYQEMTETAGGTYPAVKWKNIRIAGTWSGWFLAGSLGPFMVADFNNYRIPGTYPNQFTNLANQPFPAAGSCQVLPGPGLSSQEYKTWETPRRVATRRAVSATAWGAWDLEPTRAQVTAQATMVADLDTRVRALGAGGGLVLRPLTPIVPTVVSKPANDIMTEVSVDRLKGFNQGGTTIRETRDNGDNWTTRYTFSGQSIEMVQPLADGELLVATTDGASMRRVYRTTGVAGTGTVTVTQVIAPRVPYVKYTSAWSVSTYKSIVVLGEYGPKIPTWDNATIVAPNNARLVHLSLDHGQTFTQIFDLNIYLSNRGAPLDQQHVHGVAWDPYWDRIWITFGDAADGIVFSDDLGKTWQTAVFVATSPSPTQVVGIVPLPDCVLFGGDTTPQVQRIMRTPGKSGALVRDVAFEIPGKGHLMQASHIHRGELGVIAYMLFGAEGSPAKSFLVAARSGDDVVPIWEDTVEQAAGFGGRGVTMTLDGVLVVAVNDQKAAGLWSQITGKAPGY